MPTIRPMRAADWETYRDVRLAALLDTPSAFGASYADEAARTDHDWETIVHDRCASGMSSTWLVDDAGEVVGLVSAFRADATRPSADLVSMWVAPAARSRGLARQLVDTVLDWARSSHLTDVSLWVTRGNAAAQRLYESAGFVVTGEHQALPSDPCKDEVRMTITVGPATRNTSG